MGEVDPEAAYVDVEGLEDEEEFVDVEGLDEEEIVDVEGLEEEEIVDVEGSEDEEEIVDVEGSEDEEEIVDVEGSEDEEEDMGEELECHRCKEARKLAPVVKCTRCGNGINEGGAYHKHEGIGWLVCQSCFRKEKKEIKVSSLDKNNNCGGSKESPEEIPPVVKKTEFLKEQNLPSEPEPLVRCHRCDKSFHCICVGFVVLKTAPVRKYICSSCRANGEGAPIDGNTFGRLADCSYFSETDLSTYLQNRLNLLLPDGTDEVFVRVLSCVKKKYILTRSLKTFLRKVIPDTGDLPYTSRVIACFQKQKDGGSVMFFAIYFQEYGHDCPLPNRNTIHISMLDSAQLFEPSALRRKVYYSVLVSYLGYMKDKGFDAVGFWSCPPITEETEYIFPRRPTTQQTLTTEILQVWYQRMMRIAESVRNIEKISTLYQWVPKDKRDFFRRFPLYEGDFWPAQVEEAINTAQNEKNMRPPPKKKTKKSKIKDKRSNAKPSKSPTELNGEVDSHVFTILKRKLRQQEHNFYMMTLKNLEDNEKEKRDKTKKSPGENDISQSRRTEPIIENPVIDTRDNLVKFFQSYGNQLEFRDVRKAKYATKALLLQMVIDAPDIICSNCKMQILSIGYTCTICLKDFCKSCSDRKKHEHVRKYIEIMPTLNQKKVKFMSAQSNGSQYIQLKKGKRLVHHVLQKKLLRNKCPETNMEIDGEEKDRDTRILVHLENCSKTICAFCQSITGIATSS